MKRFFIGCLAILAAMTTMYAQKKPYSVTWRNFNIYSTKLPEAGKLAVKPADGSGDSRWSVGCETLDRDYADFNNYKKYVGELGVGYARIQSGWAKCEPEKGKYDFKWLDEIVDGLNEQGVRPWMCLCYGNPLYGADRNLGAGIFTTDEVMKAWRKYVRETVKHYGNRVAMWEIWNEPNLRAKNNPEIYAEMLIATAEEIRKVDKDAIILGFGLAGCSPTWPKKVMDILKERGKVDLIDLVSFHPYYPNPDNATSDIMILDSLMKSYSPKLKLFQGETGCPSILEFGHAMNHYEWSEYKQAKWDIRRMANDFRLDIMSNIFTMVDLQYEFMLQSFGLIRMNLLKKVVYKRPSFYAVQHMANLLTTKVHAFELQVEHNATREISIVGIKDDAGNAVGAMLWYSDQMPTDNLEKDNVSMTIKGLKLKDPVYVEPITGKVHELKTVILRGGISGGNIRLSGLPMWDSPIFIMERSQMNMQ